MNNTSMWQALRRAAVVMASAMILSPLARAEDSYPSRPVTIVVGYTPGGANDVLARIIGERMSALMKQSVVVENRPGVASIVGATLVAKAKPDGYTLLMGASGPMSFNPALYKELPYSPLKSFVPISLVGTFPLILLTQSANPDTATLPKLIEYAKSHPGKLNYSASSTSFQLVSELFKKQSDTDFMYVPYKGSSDSIIAVGSGDAAMTLVDSGPAMTAIRGTRVRPLAISSPARVPYLPDTPTFKELGVDMVVELWSGLFAPAGTPPAIVARLEGVIREALATPEVQQRINGLSITPRSSTSQELGTMIEGEIKQWKQVARKAGIEPN